MLFLNNASTTKPDERVISDFVWCATHIWQNPSDINDGGLAAKEIIKISQEQIAKSINANPNEIVFTSGASESNNWAIKGYVDKNNVDVIITTSIEHPSVYETCMYLKEVGKKIIFLPVDKYGFINLEDLEEALSIFGGVCRVFVSIMMSNNEIGTIQPIKRISEIVHKYGAHLHVDAVQSYMHIPIDVQDYGIDLMSTSFHKFGGFKNCGFLYIKDGIKLTPLIHGGHQFDDRRAGTENVPMIYAMGNQVNRMNFLNEANVHSMCSIYKYLLNQIYEKCKVCEIILNGSKEYRMKNNVSLTFRGINAEKLIYLLESEDVIVSAGSACCAGEKKPSRILKAIGLSDEDAFSTIRISLNKDIELKDIDLFVDKLVQCINNIKMFEI